MNIRDIPRPERSGCISVLVTYFLICTYCDLQPRYHFNSGTPLQNLFCWVMPWECIDYPDSDPPEKAEKRDEPKWVYLSDVGIGKKPCTCHYDYQIYGKPIVHFHSELEQECSTPSIQPWVTILEPPSKLNGAYTTLNGTYVLARFCHVLKDPVRLPGDQGTKMTFWVSNEVCVDVKPGEGRIRMHCE